MDTVGNRIQGLKEIFFFLQGERGESRGGTHPGRGRGPVLASRKKGLGAFEGVCKTGKHFAGYPVAIRMLSAKANVQPVFAELIQTGSRERLGPPCKPVAGDAERVFL